MYIYIYIQIIHNGHEVFLGLIFKLRKAGLNSECPAYDTKQSDGESPMLLKLWGLPSLTDPLWPTVVTPDMILSMAQIELNCVLMLN